jgi:ketosteroid isomerase-like protein
MSSLPEDARYADQKDAARANRAFYRAFEKLDLEAMAQVWLDDERIRCVHPGGELLVGRSRVLQSWAAIFASTDSIEFALEDLEIQVTGDVAWATLTERITVRAGGQEAGSATVATNVFERTAAGWKLVLHHGSPLERRFFPPGS